METTCYSLKWVSFSFFFAVYWEMLFCSFQQLIQVLPLGIVDTKSLCFIWNILSEILTIFLLRLFWKELAFPFLNNFFKKSYLLNLWMVIENNIDNFHYNVLDCDEINLTFSILLTLLFIWLVVMSTSFICWFLLHLNHKSISASSLNYVSSSFTKTGYKSKILRKFICCPWLVFWANLCLFYFLFFIFYLDLHQNS